MIIKVELYFEISRKSKGPLPRDIRQQVQKVVMDESPKTIYSYFADEPRNIDLEVTRLSLEQIEKIRTGR